MSSAEKGHDGGWEMICAGASGLFAAKKPHVETVNYFQAFLTHAAGFPGKTPAPPLTQRCRCVIIVSAMYVQR